MKITHLPLPRQSLRDSALRSPSLELRLRNSDPFCRRDGEYDAILIRGSHDLVEPGKVVVCADRR